MARGQLKFHTLFQGLFTLSSLPENVKGDEFSVFGNFVFLEAIWSLTALWCSGHSVRVFHEFFMKVTTVWVRPFKPRISSSMPLSFGWNGFATGTSCQSGEDAISGIGKKANRAIAESKISPIRVKAPEMCVTTNRQKGCFYKMRR